MACIFTASAGACNDSFAIGISAWQVSRIDDRKKSSDLLDGFQDWLVCIRYLMICLAWLTEHKNLYMYSVLRAP